ncbi:MAG: hypothetical protein HKN45_05065 [Flavobacteriales bacterium]|nr:hypothetical protein [Flavobacteriales bacterium]
MRFINITTRPWSILGLFLFAAVLFSGCGDDDDDDDPTVTPVEDGLYIVGDASAFGSPSLNGNFSIARNEVFNGDYNSGAIAENDRPELLEAFAAISSTGSFTVRQINGSTTTDWGFGGDLAVIPASSEADGPQVDFQRGSLVAGGSAITVPADGLYHIILDTEAAVLVVTPVAYWGVIGAATPGGWSSDTQLPSTGFSTSGMTFQATDIAMTLADYKFRHSGGWKINIDENFDNGAGVDPGIKVNTNFGGSPDMLVPGGDNISNTVTGFYTVSMDWTPGEGFAVTLTKTDDLPTFDYSNTNLGLIGAGLTVNGVAYTWDEGEDYQSSTPAVNGNIYTWNYTDVEVNTSGGGFKVREDGMWANINFGYTGVTMAGSAAADFETNGDGNFVPLVDGAVYNFTLEIDGATDLRTFTAEPA